MKGEERMCNLRRMETGRPSGPALGIIVGKVSIFFSENFIEKNNWTEGDKIRIFVKGNAVAIDEIIIKKKNKCP